MIIRGIGIDLCRVDRVRRSVNRFGKSWLDELFSDQEQEQFAREKDLAMRAARGFALKEACSKALGTGFAVGVHRRDFEVCLDVTSSSVALLHGAAELVAERFPAGTRLSCHVELTADESWVSAIAVLASPLNLSQCLTARCGDLIQAAATNLTASLARASNLGNPTLDRLQHKRTPAFERIDVSSGP